jgi:hypothetical protein
LAAEFVHLLRVQAVCFGGGQGRLRERYSHVRTALEQQIHGTALRDLEQSIALVVGNIAELKDAIEPVALVDGAYLMRHPNA